MSYKGFSIFRSGGHFVQRSGTILARAIDLGGDVVFLFVSCDGHLVQWSGTIFSNFGRGYSRNISVNLL